MDMLTDALARCRREDVRSPQLTAALAALEKRAKEHWPFEQVRRALEMQRDEDRWQTTNAAVNAIRRVCSVTSAATTLDDERRSLESRRRYSAS
jgi:hypothetical protein